MNHFKQFHALLTADGSQRPHQLFADFCRTSAIALQQPFLQSQELEHEYLAITSRHKKETVLSFSKMLAIVVDALEQNPEQDFLGEVFHYCEFHNTFRGQFFTPYIICQFMAECTIGELEEDLRSKKFLKAHEPACGSGAMLIAMRNTFIKQGRTPHTELWISAMDIDRMCADMCYIQLSLLGVAAEVNWGDTIRMEIWDTMLTPIHHLYGWELRLRAPTDARETIAEDAENSIEFTIPKPKFRGAELLNQESLF